MNTRHILGALVALILYAGATMRAAEPFVAFRAQTGYARMDVRHMDVAVDAGEDKAVHLAVANLKEDFERVSTPGAAGGTISRVVVGTLASPLLRPYLQRGIISRQELEGMWEKYLIVVHGKELVIAGSDRRGCVYGIYELSRQLGVSPWYWWADIPVARHDEVYLRPGRYTDGEPKVRYRGIFINDENPCMQKWARLKFGGMNAQMYGRVYELLLRMKANLLWPGMWGSFKEYKPMVPVLKNPDGSYEGNCFNWDDPMNPRLAHEMGIVVGTSHHEPMQRSQQEWIRTKAGYGNGEWNYQTNGKALRRFFREGMEQTKDYESMITIGMRGDEDRPMADAGGREANMRLLRRIIDDQRKIIASVTGKPAHHTPQVWTLYSEMLDYYDDGLEVPEDVTVMLCDDNWGDIRKIPTPDVRHRQGGFGMYYHFSYYGAPRAMKWLQQMQVQQVWQQMDLAYRSGIDRIWIVNVGDIKPAEFVTQFFMDMAWEPGRFHQDNLMGYTEDFCRSFAGDEAPEAARILNLYNKYAARITAEMLNDKTYSLDDGEYKQVRDEFMALEAEALRLAATLAASPQHSPGLDAYYQIVLHPVMAMANLYDLYYSVAMNRRLAALADAEANQWAQRAERCYRRDSLLTHYYNKVLAGGKWDGMMDEVHIGYTTWHAPQYNIMPQVQRVEAGSVRQGGYVYRGRGGQVVMEATRYYAATCAPGMAWTVIPHLGRTASAITLMPATAPVGDAALSYRLRLDAPHDSLRVCVVFSTVMPFVKGGHDVSLAFEGCAPVVLNLNKDMNWQHCYDLMYPAGAARVIEVQATLPARAVQGTLYQLNIRPLTPGLVLQRVLVDDGHGTGAFLRGQESPYSR